MKLFLVGIIIAILMASCKDKAPSPSKAEIHELAVKRSKEIIDSIKTSVITKGADQWAYDSTFDKMTDKYTYTATLKSKDVLEFDFPYDGGSVCSLTLRDSPKYGLDCMISLSSGQFDTEIDHTPIKFRFDKSKAEDWNCSRATDGSSNVLFIINDRSFINKLKKTDTVLAEFGVYHNGNQTVQFISSGLKWK